MDVLWEEFEDTKGVIKIRESKDRQHNGQKKKYKGRNDQQNTTQNTPTNPTKTGCESIILTGYY